MDKEVEDMYTGEEEESLQEKIAKLIEESKKRRQKVNAGTGEEKKD